ncbi:MAG: hypothetical protein ACE5H2_03240 [Terriglobia bacterium]
MSDTIHRAIEEYQTQYKPGIPEKSDLQPLIHRMLEQSGLRDVLSSQTIDIFWADPRVPIVGEIKLPKSGEFNPDPQTSKIPDWGYIKDRKQNKAARLHSRHQHGDGLAQLHMVMREEHAPYGIFTNGEKFFLHNHAPQFSACCFANAPVEKRCGFPQQPPIYQCDLLADKVEKIAAVLEFLHKLWDEAQKTW